MRDVEVSDETYRRLLALKNHWSFAYRRVTNKEVLDKIEVFKKEIFGHGSKATPEDVERTSSGKTRGELEEASERFQTAYKALLESGLDFEPDYTMDHHIRKMAELIEEGEEIGTPMF